jgi:polyferredoxin
VLGLIVLATGAALYLRTPLKLDVIRDRGSMGREVEDGMIENVYRLQIMNTSEQAHVQDCRQRHRHAGAGDGRHRIGRATETKAYPVRLRRARRRQARLEQD